MNLTRLSLVATLCIALMAPAVSQAQHHDERDHAHEHERYDVRHGHNHYYPERGFRVGVLPHEARMIGWHGERYWFHDGVWYRPFGGGFVVITPPFGVVVPVLPAFATLVVLGGAQYYYANDVYYQAVPEGGYAVVAPPGGDPGAPPPYGANAAPPPAPADNIFIYPKNGQPPEQQSRDRYECHRWAADQTSFDPTRPEGGVPPEAAAARRSDYMRAQQACLEARGYTVR